MTPHCTTGVAPATAFFNHQLKGKFTRVKAKFIEPGFDHKAIYFWDYDQKNKIKLHADDRQRTKHNDFKVDDHLLVRQPKLNKFSTPFSSKRFQVKQTKHSLVTAENDDKTITQNASFFKKIHPGTDLSESTNISEKSEETALEGCEEAHNDEPGSLQSGNSQTVEKDESGNAFLDPSGQTPISPVKKSARIKKAPMRLIDLVKY